MFRWMPEGWYRAAPKITKIEPYATLLLPIGLPLASKRRCRITGRVDNAADGWLGHGGNSYNQ